MPIAELLQLNPVEIAPRIFPRVGVEGGTDGGFRETRNVGNCFRDL